MQEPMDAVDMFGGVRSRYESWSVEFSEVCARWGVSSEQVRSQLEQESHEAPVGFVDYTRSLV